jgi:hemerythrin-like domain-containing protein
MAALAPSFWTESKTVHNEHQALMEDLNELDFALDGLECYSEVFANFATASQVLACGNRVAKLLPQHFDHEEKTLLSGVAKISPDLAEFAGEMRVQHGQLRVQLADFCQALERLRAGDDPAESLYEVKERGKMFTCEMRRHVELEEQRLKGFL